MGRFRPFFQKCVAFVDKLSKNLSQVSRKVAAKLLLSKEMLKKPHLRWLSDNVPNSYSGGHLIEYLLGSY